MLIKKNILNLIIALNLIIMLTLTYNAHGFSIFDNIEPSINIQAENKNDANITIEGEEEFKSNDEPTNDEPINNDEPTINESNNNSNEQSDINKDYNFTNIESSTQNNNTKSNNQQKIHGKKIDAVIKNFEIDSNIYNNKIYSNSHVNITLDWDTNSVIKNEDYVEFILPNKKNDILYFSDNKTWKIFNEDKKIAIGKAILNKDKFTIIFNKNIEKVDNFNKIIKFNTMVVFNENIYNQDELKVTVKTDSSNFTKEFTLAKDINSYITPIKTDVSANLLNKGNLQINIISDDNDLALNDYEFSIYQNKQPSRLIDKKSSNNDGEVNFYNLNSGMYYIKMTKAPYGYELDNKIKYIDFDEFIPSIVEVTPMKISDRYNVEAELAITQNVYTDNTLADALNIKYNPKTNDNFINYYTIINILALLTTILFILIKLRKKILKNNTYTKIF